MVRGVILRNKETKTFQSWYNIVLSKFVEHEFILDLDNSIIKPKNGKIEMIIDV